MRHLDLEPRNFNSPIRNFTPHLIAHFASLVPPLSRFQPAIAHLARWHVFTSNRTSAVLDRLRDPGLEAGFTRNWGCSAWIRFMFTFEPMRVRFRGCVVPGGASIQGVFDSARYNCMFNHTFEVVARPVPQPALESRILVDPRCNFILTCVYSHTGVGYNGPFMLHPVPPPCFATQYNFIVAILSTLSASDSDNDARADARPAR